MGSLSQMMGKGFSSISNPSSYIFRYLTHSATSLHKAVILFQQCLTDTDQSSNPVLPETDLPFSKLSPIPYIV